MKINCLASSSSGNCYIIQNKETTLMVEAGLDFNTTKSRLTRFNIKLNDLDLIVITHIHGDHANKRTVRNLNLYAPVLSNVETINQLELSKKVILNEWQPYKIKTIKITPFYLNHDVSAFGYIFQDLDTNEQILFINDTQFVKYNFKSKYFSTVMVECNHILDLVDMNDARARRQIKSHMSLAAVKAFLKTLNLKYTNQIYLMHLSDSHSDENLMIDQIQMLTGKPTYACCKEGGFI